MKLKMLGNCSVGNCRKCNSSNHYKNDDFSGEEEECSSGAAVVVVGVKMDSRSKELLTWAMVKIAQSGDRVVALHVIDPNTDKATLLSLVKTFDSVLAAYQGFCNLKQVDLKLKVSRGSPVGKALAREAMSYGATSLIVGTSGTNHLMRSAVSLAKFCAKTVGKDISVMAIDNGKIIFQREAKLLIGHDLQGSQAMGSRPKWRKTSINSQYSVASSMCSLEDSSSPLSSSSTGELENSTVLMPIQTQKVPESKSGWALLRKAFLPKLKASAHCSAKKSSVMQWILKLPSRQSFAAICPDHEHNVSDQSKFLSSDLGDLGEEKGIIVPFGAVNYSNTHSSASFLEVIPKELEGFSNKYSSTCRLFSYQELLSATSNFSSDNMIGKGGSSQVYRGILPDGKELAVKILKPSADVFKQFVSEIEIITTLNHTNIISLFGFCFEDKHLLLVYDLLSRGSLEDNLHGNRKSNLFGWEMRYKVALGVAEALGHLHNRAAEPIIHRDVKSSNILLSDDFEPKLSDFGLAISSSSTSYHIESTDVAGTFGYLAPEYFLHGKVIDKIDVYAYGVVLLELLTGRKPIDNGHPKGPESLVTWAKQILMGGKVADLLDPSLVVYDDDQIDKMVLAASLCIRLGPQHRPNISIVAKLLQGDQETIKWARQQVDVMYEADAAEGQQSSTNIQSFINLALLNLEDHSLSSSSTEQAISVEDYLLGRWSRTSSFDQTLV